MTLQNKVMPNGEIVAVKMVGQLMGNRGGRFHDPETRKLHPTRRWVSRQWICCKTTFNSRLRQVMGNGYTELFFLDEITALAAGHRPCFECRRSDARRFAECWAEAHSLDRPPKAAEMDRKLHQQRLDGRKKNCFKAKMADLPDGAVIASARHSHALKNRRSHQWSPAGYVDQQIITSRLLNVLTPPAIIGALKAGYQPRWHNSIAQFQAEPINAKL